MNNVLTQIIFLVISSFVSIYIVFDFMNRMFGRSKKGKWETFLIFIIVWVLFLISNMMAMLFLNITLLFVIPIFVGIYLFGAGNKNDFFLILLLIIFLPLSEIMSQLVHMLIFSSVFAIKPGQLFNAFMIFLIYQCAMYFMEKYIKPDEKRRKPMKIIIVPIISLYLLAMMIFMITQTSNRGILFMAILGCILIFVLNMFVYYLFDKISELGVKEQHFHMKEQQAQMKNRYFIELERKYESTQKLFHDIKRHVHLIERLCEENEKSGEAKAYTADLLDKVNGVGTKFHTNNQIVNILVNDKIAVSEYHDISFTYNCEDVDLKFIQDIDLVTMLSNLLDNAFDASLQVEEKSKYVDLCICQINDFVLLNISNACKDEIKYKNNRFLSTKRGHLGIGLSNVKDIVNKYDGTMEIFSEKNRFTVQISFMNTK